jgi:hypothetical protein
MKVFVVSLVSRACGDGAMCTPWHAIEEGPRLRRGGLIARPAVESAPAARAAGRRLTDERWTRIAAAAVLAGFALASVGGSPANATMPSDDQRIEAGMRTTPRGALSGPSLMRWVRRYASRPNHRTGTHESAKLMRRISRQLDHAGLRVRKQRYEFPRFLATKVRLSVGGSAARRSAIAPMLYSGRTTSSGLTAPLYDGEDGAFDPARVRGKIVVVSPPVVLGLAVGLWPTIEAAREGHAAGLVAVTDAPGDYPAWQNVNARLGTGRLPTVIVGRKPGARLVSAAGAGRNAKLTLAARLGTACDRDVWGVLPGRHSAGRAIVGVPATSWVPSANEHGSAVAVLLALARHYAHLPRSRRPLALRFLATSGAELGFLGLPMLMDRRPHLFSSADAYVHLGSGIGAPTLTENADGSISVSPEPDPTGSLYDSENRLLRHVPGFFADAGAPVKSTEPHLVLPGGQQYVYQAGIPMVSFTGGNLFHHTAGDLPRWVDPTLLAAEAKGFRRSIDLIGSLAPGALRAANAQAAAYGDALVPNPVPGQTVDPNATVTEPRPVRRCR